MAFHPADQHRDPAGQQAVPEIAAKEDGKTGSGQHAARKPQSGIRMLRKNCVQLRLKCINGRRCSADAAAERIQRLQCKQVIPGGMPQPPGLGLRRQLRHGQRDNDAGSDHEYIHILGTVSCGNAVQRILHPKNLCTTVLQSFTHPDQNAEKMTDLGLSHRISLFSRL